METRNFKDKSLTQEQVRADWQQGFAAAGTTPEAVKAAIGASKGIGQGQGRGEGQDGFKTAETVVSQALAHLTETEAVVKHSAALQTAARISGGQHCIEELTRELNKQAIIQGRDEKGVQHLTTPEMRALEQRNIETLKSVPAFKSQTSKAEVGAWLSKLERPADGSQPIKLSDGQRQSVINELAGGGGFAVVQGDPGTGKTFASSMIERFNNEVLKPSGREHCTINVAYTGKAAAEMSAASGKPAFTIDSFLNAYNSGKIVVGDPARAQAHNAATMNRAERTTTAAERSFERIGHLGNTRLGTVDGKSALQTQERNNALQGRETNTKTLSGNILSGVDRHEKNTKTYGDKLLHSSRTSGTISRADGSKSEYQESSWGSRALGFSRTTREERTANSLKITKSTTRGRITTGVTRTINSNGQVTETRWEGHRGLIGGKFELDKSETRQYTDHRAAAQVSSSMVYRAGVALGLIDPAKASQPQVQQGASLGVVQHISTTPTKTLEGQGQAPAASPRSGKPAMVIPAGAQVCLKIDESSFLGARQTEQLLKVTQDLQNKGIQTKIEFVGDTKQLQSIQAGDIFRQAQNLAKDGKGDLAEMKEINRQKNPELLAVANKLNENGDRQQLKDNAREALGMLKDQGRVTEVEAGKDKAETRQNLIDAAMKLYMREADKLSNNAEKAAVGEKQSVMMVTGTNALKNEL
ncbi:MAG TPA: AAA family ATPase, partial [Oligoflexia bacterium]|nr:AAA family ATPase [Oligoflexia bacterium]